MSKPQQLLSAFALTALCAAAQAGTTTYANAASFMTQVAAGAYTEAFTGLASPAGSTPAVFSGAGFSYSASSSDGIYLEGGFLGTNQIDQALTINFTGGNVTAVGGNFFTTNLSDEFQAVSVAVTLSDGTTVSFTPASMADSYRGFVSDMAITSLSISAPGQSLYASLDNFTVGTAISAVPEPASWMLAGLGLAGLLALRRRSV